MITAKEAKELAGPSVEEHVEEACEQIKKVAKQKKRKIHLKDFFWSSDAYNNTKEYRQACKALENLGFKVETYIKESQFVDACTIVKW